MGRRLEWLSKTTGLTVHKAHFGTKTPLLLEKTCIATNHQFRRRKPQSFFFSTVNGLLRPPHTTILLNLSARFAVWPPSIFSTLKLRQFISNGLVELLSKKDPCFPECSGLATDQISVCGSSLPADSHILDLITKCNSSNPSAVSCSNKLN